MAIVDYQLVATGFQGGSLVKWPALANGDTGRPFQQPAHNDRSVHVKGTFGAGGTCIIEGSNELVPATYATLNDPQGNVLSFTAEKIEAILENVLGIRPRISAGDGTTAVDVYLLLVGGAK